MVNPAKDVRAGSIPIFLLHLNLRGKWTPYRVPHLVDGGENWQGFQPVRLGLIQLNSTPLSGCDENWPIMTQPIWPPLFFTPHMS